MGKTLTLATGLVAILAAGPCATNLGDLANTLKPGEWAELQTNGLDAQLFDLNCFGALLGYAEGGVWDPNSRQVLFIGQGHNAPQKFITYSDATNTWSVESKPFWDCGACAATCIGHSFNHNAVDPAGGNFFYFKNGTVWKYHIASKTWSSLPAIQFQYAVSYGGLAYSPEMKGLIFAGRSQIYRYSDLTNTWSLLGSGSNYNMASYQNFAEYCPVDKVILVGGGTGIDCCNTNDKAVFEIDSAGKVTKRANAPVALGPGLNFTVADPASRRMIAFSYSGGTVRELDLSGDTWRTLPAKAPFAYDHFMAVPVSSYGVIFILNSNFGGSAAKVYLYRHTLSGTGREAALVAEQAGITIIPNPSRGRIAISTGGRNRAVLISRPDGRRAARLVPGPDGKALWKSEGFPKGIYLVTVTGTLGRESRKIFLE